MTERVSAEAAALGSESPAPFTLLPLGGDAGMVCEGDVCFVPSTDGASMDAAGSPASA